MSSLTEIINSLKAAKPELEQKCNISEIGIFGSYTRNEQNEKSDIDILIELSENIGLLKFIQIENLIKSIIGEKAEVVIKSDIRPELRDNILKETIFI